MDDCQKVTDINKIRENIQNQLDELESLRSMFCNPGELKVDDTCTIEEAKLFVNRNTNRLPPYLDLTINLQIDYLKFELCITLPHDYPNVLPDLFVRNPTLSRIQHTNLNKDLMNFMTEIELGEPCVFSAVTWVQDNAFKYVETRGENEENGGTKDETLIRYWIYSHHIYSKTKRREILSLAQSLNLTGFCLPGKPGIICVEGLVGDCNEWWQSIKSLTWKRIFCKVTEENKDSDANFLKFSSFEEIVFQNNSIKCNHMDMGGLSKYLEEHGCAYVFKDIFGVEAKTNS